MAGNGQVTKLRSKLLFPKKQALYQLSVLSPGSRSGVGESPAAARAFAVITFDHREERRGLRDSHDRLKGQRGTMGIVPVGDAGYGMAQDLDRRLWKVFVIIGGARFSQVLQKPRLFLAGLNDCPGPNTG
jgi:hypothetical protein